MQISLDKLPSLSSLVHDYCFDYDKVQEFFNGDFRDPATYVSQLERVQAREIPRERLAAILSDQNQSYGCGPLTLQNIESLVQERACAVVTGQQVGLFSGPLYTIYKALTAIKLAESLSKRHGIRVVPIFWMAGEDHDFAEVNHIDLLDQANQVQRISYEHDSSSGRVPVGGLRFSSEIETCIEQLDAMTPPSEFKAEILSLMSGAYRPGRSFTEAFSQWLTCLCSTYGLVLIDPDHPDLKAMGHDVFLTEISQGSPSSRCVMQTSSRLVEGGYKPQVPQQEERLNLFLAEHERLAIHLQDEVFAIKGTQRRLTKDEMVDLLHKSPHAFSPNVLLRPLWQDSILPTIAYVGGPGEIAYFAQLKGVYDHFEIPMPVIYPRKGFTFLEKSVDRSLEQFSLSVQDVWSGLSAVRDAMAAAEIPETLSRALESLDSHVDSSIANIGLEAASLDGSLAQSVDATHRKIKHQLSLLEERILKAAKRRQEVVGRKLQTLENKLYPKRHLQERVLSATPFLMKYGLTWLEDLYQAMDVTHFDHQFFRISEGERRES
ncbi:MAG: bacillithiol biosynthesis cysteine-adding enzyme BshC [bacterium]|nr:bacillithiol biosynthesis cysteine-adding enzyme BshC [bacterium]